MEIKDIYLKAQETFNKGLCDSLNKVKEDCICKIVNKYKHTPTPNDLYIGRGSLLGNPYTHRKGKTMAKYIVKTREESIERYKDYFYNILLKDENAIELLNTINDNTILICFCSPQPCHGNIIREWYINKQKNKFKLEINENNII